MEAADVNHPRGQDQVRWRGFRQQAVVNHHALTGDQVEKRERLSLLDAVDFVERRTRLEPRLQKRFLYIGEREGQHVRDSRTTSLGRPVVHGEPFHIHRQHRGALVSLDQ